MKLAWQSWPLREFDRCLRNFDLAVQDAYVVNAVLETKGCPCCRNVQGVPGDEWQEHGYFVFGEIAVHISQPVNVGGRVHDGVPITTAWRSLLQRVWKFLIWMGQHPDLAQR